ncbi:hypothetical protein [Corynebacterium sp.]|uniref:hypothetical protein n=1 Tax=Corynebacterium sp. TaxID=1720 RepID=UPI0026E0BE6E|nr:hypothetical protein [Corynebacterium sp.]MDO5513530.1 hypothetical protein [Corynebacterium sp.]
MPKSLPYLLAQAESLADQFESYEPQSDDLNAPLPPLMSVKLAHFRRIQAEADLAAAIAIARESQISWRALGDALGMSGEAVRQRYAS